MGNQQRCNLVAGLLACTATLSPLGSVGQAGSGAASASRMVPPTCGSSLLTWFAPQGNGYAGGASYVIEFSNIGTSACAVRGYPRLALTENGRQEGQASRDDPLVPAAPVTLQPGQTAHVVLLITDAGALCRPVPTNGLSIRPPGSGRASHFQLVAFGACPGRSTLRIDTVNRGVGVPFYTIR